MAEGKLKIHSENILPIIKKWLYSDKDIFVRELVSNSCDAISKLKILIDATAETFRIDITIDKEKKQLIFEDNGLGMDHDEVEKYIAQLAFSGAEDFVKKYEQKNEKEQIIGHFGLGFYSSFMVANHVEIQTLSYKPEAKAVCWKSDGSSTYTIDASERLKRGTKIILSLADDEAEYLEEARLKEILRQNCAFLPYPIHLNGTEINEKEPLWLKAPAECTEQEYLDFYHTLFPMEGDPLFWIHLNVDYPFHLKGILYFPRLSKENDIKKQSIKLFCNRVFVSDNCQDLLPDYLMLLKGAIDSPDIPLNVSRSYLQMDRTVRQLGQHIAKKIADRLNVLYRDDREKFISYWKDIETILKYGALQDEKFYEKIKSFLIWKTSNDTWATVEEVLEASGKKEIFYTQDEKQSSQILNLYKEQKIEVLIVPHTLLDQALIQFLESKTDSVFKRIDSALEESICDPSKEKGLLDAEGRSEGGKLADLFRKNLETQNLEVEAKSLANNSLFGFLMMKEQERRMRDSFAFRNQEMMGHAHGLVKPTFVINTNNKLIQAISKVEKSDPDLAKEMVLEVYDLAQLSQQEMRGEDLSHFIERSGQVLEKLACKLTDS